MAERTDVQTLSGAVLSISATLPATYDAAGYGASAMVYTEVGEIEDFGEHGARANITSFTPVKTAFVKKLKGAIDYGTKSLVIGNVPSDAGQDILEAAMASKNHYSVKIQYPPGDGEAVGEIQYLDVIVASFTNQDGAVDDVRKRAVDLAICRKPVVVPGV